MHSQTCKVVRSSAMEWHRIATTRPEKEKKSVAELYFAMQRNGKVSQRTEKAITEPGGIPAERIIK